MFLLMSDDGPGLDNPILGSPYEPPEAYFEIGPHVPTGNVKTGRRPSETFIPVPTGAKGATVTSGGETAEQQGLDFDVTGERREQEMFFQDGERVLVRSIWPRRMPDGATDGAVITFVDVTSLRRAEQARRASEASYRRVVDLVPSMLWAADASGTVTYMNERWYAYTGVPTEIPPAGIASPPVRSTHTRFGTCGVPVNVSFVTAFGPVAARASTSVWVGVNWSRLNTSIVSPLRTTRKLFPNAAVTVTSPMIPFTPSMLVHRTRAEGSTTSSENSPPTDVRTSENRNERSQAFPASKKPAA